MKGHLLSTTVLVLITSTLPVFPAPLINSPWGQIAGTIVRSPTGVLYHAYLGIPFALPPVGERRFAKPVRHPGPGVGEVFNASSLGDICPQLTVEVLSSFPDQSEDCLTLNVYVPATDRDGFRSVMVWIYGGGYFVGSAASYSPSRLVTEGDVIVVVIQYRLAVLGFLASGDEAARGNYGLWDQTLAMIWVKDNIRAFGGDPDTVTLFGESAGAGSIGFQLLSPYGKGLFKRGIQQSGTPLSSWAINKNPSRAFHLLAQRTNCSDSCSWTHRMAHMVGGSFGEFLRMRDNQRVVDCLRQVSAEKLVQFSTMRNEDGEMDYFDSIPWIPVVDGDLVPKLPEDLLNDVDYLRNNEALSKDIMIGVNNNEGGYVVDLVPPPSPSPSPPPSPSPSATAPTTADGRSNNGDGDAAVGDDGDGDKSNEVFTAFATFSALDESVEKRLLRAEISYRFPEVAGDEKRLNTLVDVLNFFYLRPVYNGTVSVQGIADSFADVYFTTGAVAMSKQLARAHEESPERASGHLYLYLFDHYPASKAGLPLQGVNHGEDMVYEFDSNLLLPKDKFTEQDFRVEDNFLAILADFAKNGNANQAMRGQLQGATWPEFSLTDESYLSLSAQPSVRRQLYGKRVALWLDLLPSLVNSTRPHCPHVSVVRRSDGGDSRYGSSGHWHSKRLSSMQKTFSQFEGL